MRDFLDWLLGTLALAMLAGLFGDLALWIVVIGSAALAVNIYRNPRESRASRASSSRVPWN